MRLRKSEMTGPATPHPMIRTLGVSILVDEDGGEEPEMFVRQKEGYSLQKEANDERKRVE